ncbi:MAG: phosphotransferase [Alphaproteobacteria bacterium PA2]|nr:MAG: phosphotransferase [Alphaproteobacteria bacterium PA2]
MVAASKTPDAEFAVDGDLVARLIARQHADLAKLPLRFEASGWDNVMFRLGDDLAVRLPRRTMGAQFMQSEQAWLQVLGPRLPLLTPAPVRLGVPDLDYPWTWSIVPWIEGETADLDPPDEHQGVVLAAFFKALHQPAPPEAPHNPVRGVPLSTRQDMFEKQLEYLGSRTDLIDSRALEIWRAGVSAPTDLEGLWVHGDPHPRNVIVRNGKLKAFIDWGDMTRGDPATDLSSIWMLLDAPAARQAAMEAYGASEATWARARGWAMYYVVVLLAAGIADDPRMKAIAEKTLARLLA